MTAERVRDLRRWVSMSEAVRRLPGAKQAVIAWLRERRLVRRLPWGTEAVDLEAVYHRLTLESPPADPLAEGQDDFLGVVEQPQVVQLESPGRRRRPAKKSATTFRYMEP